MVSGFVNLPRIQMKLRLRFSALVLLWWCVLAPVAPAHAPFDCSSRVIIHPDAVEVMLTVGNTLGEKFIASTGIAPQRLSLGHPTALAPGFATNLFTVSADGQTLDAREADVISDGLEFQFHFEYALAPARALGVETKFIPALNASRMVPVVLTDENGNIFASTILSPEKTGTEFALPSSAPNVQTPSPTLGERDGVRGTTTNPAPQIIPATATETKPAPSFLEFLKLGIGHILNVAAFDHLLFLTALLLGCRQLKPMLMVITGFTLAHSLTLALAALNIITLSPRIVEPLIAASIIFVAAENLRRTAQPGRSNTLRYALTCGFGFIHGFGFASALRDSGLAGKGMEIVSPLLAFNLGVEIGQLTVAAVLLPLLLLLERQPWFARHGARLISVLVILVAAFWLWQRLSAT